MGAGRITAPVSRSAPTIGTQVIRRPDVHRLDRVGDARFSGCGHDRDKAQAKGSKDIFVNILTDTGLVQRYLTDWAAPTALVRSIGLRLGVPWYAYDTVTFSGEVTVVEDGLVTVKVTGSKSLGDHVIATATLTIRGA